MHSNLKLESIKRLTLNKILRWAISVPHRLRGWVIYEVQSGVGGKSGKRDGTFLLSALSLTAIHCGAQGSCLRPSASPRFTAKRPSGTCLPPAWNWANQEPQDPGDDSTASSSFCLHQIASRPLLVTSAIKPRHSHWLFSSALALTEPSLPLRSPTGMSGCQHQRIHPQSTTNNTPGSTSPASKKEFTEGISVFQRTFVKDMIRNKVCISRVVREYTNFDILSWSGLGCTGDCLNLASPVTRDPILALREIPKCAIHPVIPLDLEQ
ncbi:hypothetical protein V8F33_009599 [Rhypophila sp. PSN 637]